MYYLTVDHVIPFQIESSLPEDCFQLFFGGFIIFWIFVFFWYFFFEIRKNQNIQNIFVLANFVNILKFWNSLY